MAFFFIFGIQFKKLRFRNLENGHISLNLAQNEKIKTLYFLQLLKLKVIKCPYFFLFKALTGEIWPLFHFSDFQGKIRKTRKMMERR